MPRSEVKRRALADWASRSRVDYDARVGRLGSIMLLGLAACASSVPRTVPRVVDGRVMDGPVVSPYAYEWFIEGEIQAAKGRHDQAAMAFESATAAPAGDVVLVTRLAEEYEMSGAARRADRAISLARRHYPTSARVALTEGRIWQHRGEVEQSLGAFARAHELEPGWAEPIVATADLLAARGLSERAAIVLLDYLEAAPEEHAQAPRTALVALARRTGNPEVLARALTFEPSLTLEERARSAATLALALERPALAARMLGGALGDTQNVSLWLEALARSGEDARAADYVSSGNAARTASVEDRADLLLALHEADRALRLLAAAERSARVQHARGSALLARGDYVGAASILAAIPLGASPFESSRLALADCSLSKGRRGAAAEALSTVPHASLAVRQKLAEIYVDEGDLREALRLFDARQPRERAALAAILERAGQFDEAAAYYASVRVSASNDRRVRARASAEQLASRGHVRGAIVILEQWASFAPDDLYSRVRLIELLQAERRDEEANRRGRRALEVVDDARLRAHLRRLLRAPPTAAR